MYQEDIVDISQVDAILSVAALMANGATMGAANAASKSKCVRELRYGVPEDCRISHDVYSSRK